MESQNNHITVKHAKALAIKHSGRLPRAGWEAIILDTPAARASLVREARGFYVSIIRHPFSPNWEYDRDTANLAAEKETW